MSTMFVDKDPNTPITAAWLNSIEDLRLQVPIDISALNAAVIAVNAALTAYKADIADPVTVTKGAALVGRCGQVVNSVAELRTLSKLSASKFATTTGYYAPGDKGDGNYYLDAADLVSADNGGTVIVAADGGRWKLFHSGIVSVRQFGAKGDGVTNDTARLQACITAVDTLIPAGNFLYSSVLLVPNDRSITGWGYSSRLFANASFVPTVMAWAGGDMYVTFGNALIVSSGAGRNIRISGIFSDWTALAPNFNHHVHMRNTIGCRVFNCDFNGGADATAFTLSSDYQVTNNTARNTRNCAYDQWENSHDGLVANNIAYISLGYGMLATGDTSLNTPGTTYNINFVNNIIHGDGTSNSGIGLWLQSGSNATSVCHSCVAVGNRFDGFDVCIRMTGGGKHVVVGNRGYNGKVTGISVSAEVAGFGSLGNVISDNELEICGNITSAPIHLQDNSGGNILNGNRSVNTNGSQYGLVFDVGATNNTAHNNIIGPGSLGVVLDVSGLNNTDYEQSFTPTLISSGGGTPTYGTVYGNAQKLGRRVFFNLRINLSALGSLAAGNLSIGGLPWTSMSDTSDDVSPCALTASNLNGALAVPPLASISANANVISLLKWAGGTTAALTVADITGTATITISGHYRFK